MVDYSTALPQQQFFQAPDMLQNAMRMQQIQAQGAQMRELARQRSEEEALRGITVDPNSPEYVQQLQRIKPSLVFPALTAQSQNRASDRAAEASARQAAVSTAELALKNRELIAKHGQEFRDNLRMVDAYPEDQRPAAYGRLISSLPPDLQTVFPRQYSPDAVRLGMSTTTQLLDAAKPQYQMFDGVPVAVTPATGTFTPLREAGVGAPVGGGAPAVNNALAARAGAPMGGAGAPAMPGAGAAAAPAGFDMDRAKQAIAGIESGGRYGALGPVTNRGDRAFGKYQVMGANIPSWTKEALGRSMTPAEFLASPEAQERVFETQFGKSVAKYGNPADAASVWFSGRPLAKAGNASDVLGTTVPQYAQKFMAAYEGGANTPAMMRAPGFASSSGIPANVGLPVAPVLNAFAGPQPPQQGNALAMQAAPMTQLQAAPIAAPQPAPALSAFDSAQQTAPALSPFQQAQKDARDRALVQTEEKTAAMERGKATEKEKTENKARRETAGRVLQVLNDPEIDNLVKNSTSGALEYGLAAAKGAVTGTSTTGMENIGRLATIQEALLFRLANGKLGGGFTDKDSDTIRGMLGRVADPNTPANVRIKTLQDVRAMMTSVATGENMTIAPAAVEEAKPPARRNLKAGDIGAKKPDSFAHFMSVAKEQNPNVSERELEAYYNKTYGGR
jgi:hypothetical protein